MKKFVMAVSLLISCGAHATGATDVCKNMANYNTASSVTCVGIAASGTIQDNAAKVCNLILPNSVSSSIECLKAAVNKNFDANATDVCAYMVNFNISSAVSCITTTANKTYSADEAGICKSIINSSVSSGLNCLGVGGRPYVPSAPVVTNCPSLPSMRQALSRARREIEFGSSARASLILEDLDLALAECK